MPDIQLQEYTAKIKELIANIRLDEAIAHCQHILGHYPKHIQTYCLLGEACLEKELYREAIEFFQRTLSADPENLIARVGLGIIYDEQGALPEAIWQLERAFELAPGNAEVRRELQRLYVQHNGAERSRLKLTRGALGRLYVRNGLCERAIEEFHAVLRQDPDLPDVRVALVEALWREGHRLEAVEACLELLEALPNCLKANLVLGEIWLRGGNEEAAEEKLNLARALDPENRIAQELMGRDSPLPPEDVFLPELEAIPEAFELAVAAGLPAAVPGEWGLGEEEARALGEEVPLLEPAEPGEGEEELPAWLRDLEMEVKEEPPLELAVEEPVLAEVQPGEAAPAEELPDWLQELMEEELPSPAVEALAAEKVAGAEEAPPTEIPEEEVAPLAGVPAGIVLAAAALAHEAEGEKAVAEPVAEELEPQEAEQLPEWLQVLAAEVPPVPEEAALLAEEEVAEPAEEIPAWLQEFEAQEAGEVAAPLVSEVLEETVPKGEVPASLLALVEAGLLDQADLDAAMVEMSAEDLEVQRGEEVPAWLQELIGEEVSQAEEPAPVTEGEGAVEKIPAWVLALPAVKEERLPPAEEVVAAAELEVLEAEAPPLEEVVAAAELEVLEAELPPLEEVVPLEAEVLEAELPPLEEVVAVPVAEVLEAELPPLEEVVAAPEVEVLEAELPPVEEVVAAPVAEVLEAELPPVEAEVVAPSRVDELVEQLKAQPRNHPARLELARIYGTEEDWAAALTQYGKLVSARKLLPEVLEDLQSMVGTGVDQARLHQLMGDIYVQQDQLDQALEMYRRARRSLTRP